MKLLSWLYENIDMLLTITCGAAAVLSFGMMALRIRTYLVGIPKFVTHLAKPHRIVCAISSCVVVAWVVVRLAKNEQAAQSFGVYVYNPAVFIIPGIVALLLPSVFLWVAETKGGPSTFVNPR